MSTCKGINKNGKCCKNKTKNSDGYCHKHRPTTKVDISKIEIIDLTIDDEIIKTDCQQIQQNIDCHECCICYEKIVPSNEKLVCDHFVCITCIKQLRDDRCPMCRCSISSNKITEDMKTKMKNRKKEDHNTRMNDLNREYINDFITGPWNNTRATTHSRYLHNSSGPAQNTRSATRRRSEQLNIDVYYF
jgi:hypothetical protein